LFQFLSTANKISHAQYVHPYLLLDVELNVPNKRVKRIIIEVQTLSFHSYTRLKIVFCSLEKCLNI